jgi:hypothetical protein
LRLKNFSNLKFKSRNHSPALFSSTHHTFNRERERERKSKSPLIIYIVS